MTFDAIWACARVLLAGQILHVDGVTAALGGVVQGRRVLVQNVDAFELARTFVGAVGPSRAVRCSARIRGHLPVGRRVVWL